MRTRDTKHAAGERLIVLEGGDGAGKTTAIEQIRQFLQDRGEKVVCSREPGGTPLAEAIRQLLLDVRTEPVAAHTELLLMFAARAQHVQEFIVPQLQAGGWVLLDRFTEASYAYQGGGRGLGSAPVQWLEAFVVGSLRPGRVFWLDVPPEIGLARRPRHGTLDRMEEESLVFMQAVYTTYQERCRAFPDMYRRIDASCAQSAVIAQLLEQLQSYWGELHGNL